ncbi:MAG TPA: pyruvate formate lyase family protein [Anaerolineaceae bacterium]
MTPSVKIVYRQWIEALAQTKLEFNQRKINSQGYHDTDDHGNIPWEEPIPFKRISNHPNGGSYGARCIGENFRHWLEVHPVYIHPQSALAGAWVSVIPGIKEWRPEDYPHHLDNLHEKYHFISTGIGSMNHMNPDMKIGLDLGWGGLLKKIRYYRELNNPVDTAFYDAEENLVLGIQGWIRRHVDLARQRAEVETDPLIRQNYLEIAETNAWLVDSPPRTLREACQFLAWFQSVDRMWFLGGALGQLDELLRPYYLADTQAGVIDDETTLWILASLFFNDTHYSQIGGPAPDGHDLTSHISYLILEAAHLVRIPSNLAIRLHDGLDPNLLRQALIYTLKDGTGPSISCSKGLDEGYSRNGIPIQLARQRAKVGCNWTALPGIEYCHQDVTRQCLVQPFILAFRELVADQTAPRTMEELWKRYYTHLSISVDVLKQGFDWHMQHHADNLIEIVLNLFCHGPIERGLDACAGGVDLYLLTADGIGLATVADSFAAIEQRVVREQRLTWEQLNDLLIHDYAEAEPLRLMLKNIPRFGTGGTIADRWAKRISEAYTQLVRGTPTPKGYTIIPGLFSHGGIAKYGADLDATPNGRHAGAPVSHSANPDPGFMPDGGGALTAKSNAVAEVQPGWGNSAPLQLDVDSHLLREVGGIEALESLIRTHNQLGGTLVNLNIVSKEKILAAHKDPTKYPDLMVRVTGYSAYFHSLSPEYRQQIVDRLLA